MKRTILISCLCITLSTLLLSCAPESYSPHEYGFFGGILHGIAFPFALLSKLFGVDYGLYAENNSGFFYWLGFILGLGGLGGGGSAAKR